MKILHILSITLITTLFSLPSYAFECNPDGNQSEMNACAYDDMKKADRELNRIYKALRNKMKGDKTYLRNLKLAQRAWIKFRDAELETMFSCDDDNPRICWGSMYGMLYPYAHAELTTERTSRLRFYLEKGINSSAAQQ